MKSVAEGSDWSVAWVWSAAWSADYLGMLLGNLAASFLRLSRPRAILLATLLYALPAHLLQFCACLSPRLWPLFITARLVGGVFNGHWEVLTPVFLAEIAPAQIRGRLCALVPFAGALGSVAGVGLGWLLGESRLWPIFYLLLSSLFVLLSPPLCLLPDSPAHSLASSKSEGRAADGLRFYSGHVQSLAAVRKDVESWAQEEDARPLTAPQLLRLKALRPQLWLTWALAVLNIPAALVVSCSSLMLVDVGLSPAAATLHTAVLAALTLAALLLHLWLADRVSRRGQLLAGAGLSCVCLLLLGLCRRLQSAAFFALALYGVQLGVCCGIIPLYHTLVPELFPMRARVAAKSLASTLMVLHLGVALLLFRPALAALGAWAYLCLSLPLCLAFGVCAARLPETAGRELHQIVDDLREEEIVPLMAPEP
jgi:SP family arabinose:H+ symporter-like MFS transporter